MMVKLEAKLFPSKDKQLRVSGMLASSDKTKAGYMWIAKSSLLFIYTTL